MGEIYDLHALPQSGFKTSLAGGQSSPPNEEAHKTAGLQLLWLGLEQGNNVFFLFEVASITKAKAFINNPDAAKAAESSGVTDGEYGQTR